MDLVLFATLVVGRHLIATNEQTQRVGCNRNLHAEIGGFQPVELDRQLRLADIEGGVEVDDTGLLFHFGDDSIGVLL